MSFDPMEASCLIGGSVGSLLSHLIPWDISLDFSPVQSTPPRVAASRSLAFVAGRWDFSPKDCLKLTRGIARQRRTALHLFRFIFLVPYPAEHTVDPLSERLATAATVEFHLSLFFTRRVYCVWRSAILSSQLSSNEDQLVSKAAWVTLWQCQ